MEFVAVVVVILLIAGVVWSIRQRANMMAEGVILHRERNFMEKAEEFTCSMESTEEVTNGLKKINCKEMRISIEGNTKTQRFRFAGSDWGAGLYQMGEKDGIYTYRFEFTNWKTGNGIVSSADQMNMLLTAIEKMFLEIDPDTKVHTEAIQVKTKHSFF